MAAKMALKPIHFQIFMLSCCPQAQGVPLGLSCIRQAGNSKHNGIGVSGAGEIAEKTGTMDCRFTADAIWSVQAAAES